MALALVASLTLLAACGDSGDGDSAASSTTTTAVASSTTTTAGVAVLEEGGLGDLRLGMKLAEAQAAKLVGATKPGCELGGPGELVAPLADPVEGTAFFTDGALDGIEVTSGAKTPEGIGVGSMIAEAEKAYAGGGYSVVVDESTVETFGVIELRVSRGDRALFGLTADPTSRRVSQLWIPRSRSCE